MTRHFSLTLRTTALALVLGSLAVHAPSTTTSESLPQSAQQPTKSAPARGGLIHPSQRTPEEKARLADFRRRIDEQAEQIRRAQAAGTTVPLGTLTPSTTQTLTPSPQTSGNSQSSSKSSNDSQTPPLAPLSQ